MSLKAVSDFRVLGEPQNRIDAHDIVTGRKQFAMVQRQYERTEKLQDRAESIQARSGQIVTAARRTVMIALPVVVLLIGYLTWLLFRH